MPEEAPDSVTVAPAPLKVPEILYVLRVPTELTPVTLASRTVTAVVCGAKVWPPCVAVTVYEPLANRRKYRFHWPLPWL